MREIFKRSITVNVRRDDRVVTKNRVVHCLAVRPGDHLWVQDIVAPTAKGYASVYNAELGWKWLTFRKHALVTVEGLDRNHGACMNLRFVRPNRPKVEKPINEDGTVRRGIYSRVVTSSKCTAALFAAGYQPVKIPGGACNYGLAFAMDRYGEGAEVMVAAPTAKEREEGKHPSESAWVFIVTGDQLDEAVYDLNTQDAFEDVRVETPYDRVVPIYAPMKPIGLRK